MKAWQVHGVITLAILVALGGLGLFALIGMNNGLGTGKPPPTSFYVFPFAGALFNALFACVGFKWGAKIADYDRPPHQTVLLSFGTTFLSSVLAVGAFMACFTILQLGLNFDGIWVQTPSWIAAGACFFLTSFLAPRFFNASPSRTS